MKLEDLLKLEITNKPYKSLSRKQKEIFKLLKNKHLKREELIKIICELLTQNEDIEGRLDLYTKNTYITKKESIDSLKKNKSEKRKLISNDISGPSKKSGRKKGSKNITSEILELVESGQLKEGDEYKGIKLHFKQLDKETECKDCGSKLIDTGLKQYTVKFESEPMKLHILVLENPIMKCNNPECITNAAHTTIINDPTKKGVCSVNLLIEFIIQKMLLGVPINRLLMEYPVLNRKTVTAEIMRLANRLEGLINYIENKAFEFGKDMEMYFDETTFSLTHMPLNKNGKERKKAYIYCYSVGKITIFKATIGRGSKWLRDKLKALDYDIFISSDDYSGYNFIKQDYHLLCNCHARRYFFEAVCSLPKYVNIEETSCYKVLQAYSAIFHYEKQIKDFSDEKKYECRNSKEYQKMIDELWEKVELADGDSFSGSANQKAVNYIKDNWDRLWNYRKKGSLKMENGTAENKIRKLCLIRNNSLIFNNARTAKINCNILSIVSMAKAYSLDARQYLNYIFHLLPDDESEHNQIKRKDDRTGRPLEVNYEDLVPWSNNLYSIPVEFECIK